MDNYKKSHQNTLYKCPARGNLFGEKFKLEKILKIKREHGSYSCNLAYQQYVSHNQPNIVEGENKKRKEGKIPISHSQTR